ncbi:MAG: DUF1016 N-terminal domain-containing protein [Candidatus Sumerlaeota bacterium]|nr:DUF1016 N-terminal domain-containing protein [Candidatus Sumerlaeota bacterium]
MRQPTKKPERLKDNAMGLLKLAGYDGLLIELAHLIELARRTAARSVNAVMTATYWLVGRRIVEHEQAGRERAGYGEEMLARLSADLTLRFGRGFSADNLESMRRFYLAFPSTTISETVSRKSRPQIRQTASGKSETPSRISELDALATAFPLSWSHYALLVRRSRSPEALDFYHTEALRGGVRSIVGSWDGLHCQ